MTDTDLMADLMTERQAVDLLHAGAVLPPGTRGAGERAVPLTARSYRHPALHDRVVVRLVAAELGAAEDVAAGYLGLEPAVEPVEVGLGLRQALGFPEWVLAHHPADGHHALGLMPELERIARQARTKPKAALEAYQQLAAQLGTAVPHFLPTFYEQAGRVFLALENAGYAAQLFGRARRVEAEHGLALDEDRLDAVFLEFALAGALPVKVLSGYARELAARVPADQAFERFRLLCLRRTAGGLPPSAQMATDLRRLARAAGSDPDLAEGAYLTELLALPATLRAPAGWWRGHRQALVALARRERTLRGALLDLMPGDDDEDLPALWLEVLMESGAADGLCDGALPAAERPAAERPADGTAGWLERFLAWRGARWNRVCRIEALYPLVERMAGLLHTELACGGGSVRVTDSDVDLLDLLLALGLPVADPADTCTLRLEEWALQEDRRDLLALAADDRFAPAFHRGALRIGDDHDGRTALGVLARSPGGRPLLAGWMAEVARQSSATGLPNLPDALRRLSWLPGEVLVLAEREVRAAAETDLSTVLARTLRAGVLDELGWPAWEEAVASLVARKDVEDLVVADAWPHLVVAGPQQARVIDERGTVLTHDLRIPAGDSRRDPGFHYVDGSLLVHWSSRQNNHQLTGYWHTAADRVFTLAENASPRGTRMTFLGTMRTYSLPLPGSGRATGGGVVHVGDTAVPPERALIGDGTSFWVWAQTAADTRAGWHEYDPATGALGRASLPGFLADALREAPSGSTLRSGWLRPHPTAETSPCAAPVDGLLGWRTVRHPDGTVRGEDLGGRSVTLREAVPNSMVLFPGTDQPQAVVREGYSIRLVDQDGVTTSVARTDDAPGAFAEGSLILPPVRFWHCLRPRDPQGSAALRRLDAETAAALLKAACAADAAKPEALTAVVRTPQPEALTAAVRSLLPEVGDDALVAGIAGVLRFAATQQQALAGVAQRLADKLAGIGEPSAEPTGPTDQQLREALNGLGCTTGWSGSSTRYISEQLAFLAAASRAQAVPGLLHVDASALPHECLAWTALPALAPVVALRAAVTSESAEHEVLLQLLRELDGLGLTSAEGAARWRRQRLRLTAGHLIGADGSVRNGSKDALLALGGGAFLLFADSEVLTGGDTESTVLHHDPAGLFAVPAPYSVLSSEPVGGPVDDRSAAALAEAAERGPAPWFPAAAERFAELTGVSGGLAGLVVAALPQLDSYQRNFLPLATRARLGLKVADAAVAKEELRGLDVPLRRRLVAALLPAEPARLWSEGPDADAAAEVWNAAVGRRAAVPEALLAEAVRAVRTGWTPIRALPALLDPAGTAQLSQDLAWTVRRDRCVPLEPNPDAFTADTLLGTVALTAWLAHRLPAGDPVRAALPAALAALRARLANPELLLDLNRFVSLTAFQQVAGAPTETGEGYERYGAVVLATHDLQPAPGIRTALLDSAGQDPYLPVLRPQSAVPLPAEVALRLCHSAAFAAQLADPGEPAGGARGADGTWWPQNPSHSVPDLVGAVAAEHGLGQDAAAVYLMLLAMPDPTDRNTARWTGWRPARLKAARAELVATDLVVEASRSRAGRSLFLPGGWAELRSPILPLELWKLPLLEEIGGRGAPLDLLVPTRPAEALYRRAWQRLLDGDLPRFEELKARRGRRR